MLIIVVEAATGGVDRLCFMSTLQRCTNAVLTRTKMTKNQLIRHPAPAVSSCLAQWNVTGNTLVPMYLCMTTQCVCLQKKNKVGVQRSKKLRTSHQITDREHDSTQLGQLVVEASHSKCLHFVQKF
jgi:hypothetical protein